MLRGDDVAELQQRLGALGFDAGRVDGIFGAETATALEALQRNAGLPTDTTKSAVLRSSTLPSRSTRTWRHMLKPSRCKAVRLLGGLGEECLHAPVADNCTNCHSVPLFWTNVAVKTSLHDDEVLRTTN